MTTSFPVPLTPPFDAATETALSSLMPRGAPVPPLALFRFFAHHPALVAVVHPMARFLLGHGAVLAPRDRELVILRATARAGCAYEWGVHVAFLAARVGLDEATVRATVTGATLEGRDGLLVRVVDALHERATLDDALREELAATLGAEAIVELLVLAGWYRAISGVANAAQLAHEPWAPGFPE